jgi:uncharacterized membrane protein
MIRTPVVAVKDFQRRHVDRMKADTPTPSRCQGRRVAAASMGDMADTMMRPGKDSPARREPGRSPAPATRARPSRPTNPRPPAARRRPKRPPQPRPVVIVGIAVALWTTVLGLACLVSLTLAAWVTATRHGNAVRPALATAVQAWLLANHTGLAISGGSMGIVPLGLTIGLGALLVRGGRQAARLSSGRDLFDCLAAAFAVALPYGVIAALLTKPAQWGQVRPQPLQALAGGFVLALACAFVGALRETGQWAVVITRVPATGRRMLRAGLAATVVIVGLGAAMVGAGLAAHAGRAATITSNLDGGVSASLLMAAVSVAYLPNVAIWGSALSVGPGFAVGAKTSVTLGGVHLGALPAVPLLAALPSNGAPPTFARLAILAPIAAGLLAGWLLARARVLAPNPRGPWWERQRLMDAVWGLCAGAVAGLVMGILAWLSAGPLGPGRMAQVGPSAWHVGIAVTFEVGVLSAATTWLLGWRRMRSATAVDETAAVQETADAEPV